MAARESTEIWGEQMCAARHLQRNSWAQQPSRRLIRTARHPAVASSRPGFIPTRVRRRRVEN